PLPHHPRSSLFPYTTLFRSDPFQEVEIGLSGDTLRDLVHTPSGPGMHRRVYIPQGPFIGGQLTIGMHVPLTQEQDQLMFSKLWVDRKSTRLNSSHVKISYAV